MSTKLLYFTGTGNTLWVGKTLRDNLPDAELVPVLELVPQDELVLEGTIDFLFPQYYLGLPEIVYHGLSKADLSHCEYLFGLTTCGSFIWSVTGGAQRMQDAVAHTGSKALDAFFTHCGAKA